MSKLKKAAQKYLFDTYGEWEGSGSDERARIMMAFEDGAKWARCVDPFDWMSDADIVKGLDAEIEAATKTKR